VLTSLHKALIKQRTTDDTDGTDKTLKTERSGQKNEDSRASVSFFCPRFFYLTASVPEVFLAHTYLVAVESCPVHILH
jgi:hypothetical protein